MQPDHTQRVQFTAALGLLSCLQAWDVATTHVALSHDLARELNPLALYQWNHWGLMGLAVPKVLGMVLFAGIAWTGIRINHAWTLTIMVALNGYMGWVVAGNLSYLL